MTDAAGDGDGERDAPVIPLAPPPAPRWGLPDAALAFVTSWVLSGLVLGVALAALGPPEDALPVQLAGLLGLWAGLAGVPYLVSRTKGTGSLADDFGMRPGDGRRLLTAAGIGVGSQFVLVPLVFLPFRLLFPDVDFGDQARDLAGTPTGPAFYVRAVAFVLVAPVVEELFYRGLLQGALVRRIGPAGVVIAGVVFGVSHATPQDPVALAALVTALSAFGIVLGALAHRARVLGPAIAAHMAFNATAMAGLLVAGATG